MSFQGVFLKLDGFVKANATSIQNLVIVLLIFGSEYLFELFAFKCPCDEGRRALYSWLMIFGPAFVLFVIGVTMTNMTWKLVTGCCRSPGGFHEFLIPRRSCNGGCTGLCYICIRALLASSSWIFIAFMNASYYACAVNTTPCQAEEDTPQLDIGDKALSQTIGLAVLVVGFLILLLGLFLWRMCSVYTYEHQRYADIYRDLEKGAFVARSKKVASAQIEESLDRFFAQEELGCREPGDWGKVNQTWLGVSFVGSDYAADYGYTTLHEWSIANDHLAAPKTKKEAPAPASIPGDPQPVEKIDLALLGDALGLAGELKSHRQSSRKKNKRKRRDLNRHEGAVPIVSE